MPQEQARSTTTFWDKGTVRPSFPPLDGDLTTDVLVVGAGITGLTAAALLTGAGRRVTIIDRQTVCAGETGRTTSHATELVDARYHALIRNFGQEAARLVAESQRYAIDLIGTLCDQYGMDGQFARVPGYLYSERAEDVDMLAEECDAATRAGVTARMTRSVPLPFPTAGGIEVPGQAQFHPLKYLFPLARRLAGEGVRLHETTPAEGFEDGDPCRVTTPRGTVTARDVVIAAHVPVNDRVLVHTKTAQYRSYVIAGPAASVPDGLYWDTADPYHYIRTHPDATGRVVIVGGADHRVGDTDGSRRAYESLAGFAVPRRLGVGEFPLRWSGHIVTSVDGLPFIGRNPFGSHVFIATAYAGNGTTFGTLAGRIIADQILGRDNRFADLYAPSRVKPIAAAAEYVAQNVRFPALLLRDRLTNANADGATAGAIAAGEGRVLIIDGHKCAVARDRAGALHVLSPICTHMGCDVSWNAAEQTWDCPCHGSRFGIDGRVLNGPAVSPLDAGDVTGH